MEILYPTTSFISVNEFVKSLFEEIFQRIRLKIIFSDALILAVAEHHYCTNFSTWNKNDFFTKNRVKTALRAGLAIHLFDCSNVRRVDEV